MSERARRTKTVFDAISALRDAGADTFRPGDVTGHLRDAGMPYGAWEVRGELSNLERLGLISLDEDSALWRLHEDAEFSIDDANAAYGHRNGERLRLSAREQDEDGSA